MAVYGPGCHPQNIIWIEARSAVNYLLYYTSRPKTSPIISRNKDSKTRQSTAGPYNVILTGCANKDK